MFHVQQTEYLSEKVGGPYRTRTYNQLIKSDNNGLRASSMICKARPLLYMLRILPILCLKHGLNP